MEPSAGSGEFVGSAGTTETTGEGVGPAGDTVESLGEFDPSANGDSEGDNGGDVIVIGAGISVTTTPGDIAGANDGVFGACDAPGTVCQQH